MLTKRLAACAAMVTKGGVTCDVGSDHAYLPAELLKKGICRSVVVTDIHKKPLEAARRTLTKAGVLSDARLVLCDGLQQVSKEDITDVVIAGMGGETMVHILESCQWCTKVHLILQPMTKLPVLRKWLWEHSFVWKEKVILEGNKMYVVMDVHFEQNQTTLSSLELEVGLLDWTQPEAQAYGRDKYCRLQKLAEKLAEACPTQSTQIKMLAQELAQKLDSVEQQQKQE